MTPDFMPLDGWDHVELWVGNAKQAAYYYEHAFGFRRTAYAGPETGVRDRASYVLEQNEIRLVVTSALRSGTAIGQPRLRARRRREGHRAPRPRRRPRRSARRSHGEPRESSSRTSSRTTSARSSWRRSRPTATSCTRSSAATHTRARTCRATSRRSRPTASTRASACLRSTTSSATSSSGRMEHWVGFYEQVFGMTEMIHFSDEDISTEYSALMSKVMTDGQGKVKFPINEPAEGKRKSQIDEYLEFNEGPGAQHIALQSSNIVKTVEALQRRGVDLPHDARRVLRGHAGPGRRDRRELGRPAAVEDPRRPRRRRLPAPDLHEDGAGPADALLRGDRAPRRARLRRRELQGAVRGDRARTGAPGQSLARALTTFP